MANSSNLTHRGAAPRRNATLTSPKGLEKVPTGISGLDEITGGGLPKGRPTLVCGAAGCGKTMMGIAFLAHGATEYNEPGVFVAFEETAEELASNVASLGIDLGRLIERKKLLVDSVRLERSEIEETGEYDLSGLFIRLGEAIDAIGAKRVVLDTIEVLFAGLSNHGIVRAELRRLFRWLKDKGVTAFITAEQGNGGGLTRYGLEEYVADCVIRLDQRVTDQISTRRLRIVKYRGSAHGTNEYPFLITKDGVSVLPVTSMSLEHQVSTKRIGTGVPRLDTLLGGQGYLEHERLQEMLDRQQAEAKRAEIRRRRATAHAQIESLQADLAAADQELKQIEAASLSRREEAAEARAEMAQSRMADGGRARRRK